ncbi:MAG: protein translocase subunit SecD, partial [Planctomycetaceae bacterium]
MIDFILQSLLFAQAAPADEPAAGPGVGTILLVLLLVFVLPLVLGTLLARLLKLPDMARRISIVLFALILGVMPFVWHEIKGDGWRKAIKWGIDLAGGTNLVYQIDVAQAEADGKTVNADLVHRMVVAIGSRLDPAAQEQITVRGVGRDRIEVIIPGADPEIVARKKREMTRLGKLEFAILANRRRHNNIIEQALKSPARDVRQGGRVVAGWRPVAKNKDGSLKDVHARPDVEASRVVERDGKPETELLVVLEPLDRRVTGRYLTRAAPERDQSGRHSVGFSFNQRGGNLFAALTAEYQPDTDDFHHRLAVLLDDKIHSAPNLITVISDQGQITGDFTPEEIDELVNVLNAGALEAPIIPDPISELSISPMLGADVRQKGVLAIGISAFAVMAFMVLYYRFAGIVANICLILNIFLTVGAMVLIEAAFTLPGLAGIVLTIGMAVDANVLIYERMREELERGASLRMAIHNGFAKALSAIIDSNVTTLLTAVILYMIGTDQIRGFAVTLFIGLVLSLFTTLYVGRLLFDLVERKRWIQRLPMLNFVKKPNWDFIRLTFRATVLSVVVIAVGLGALFYRGSDNLDIDFTGGTMVTFQFVEDHEIDDVRAILQQDLGTSITVELLDIEQQATRGKLFRLRTRESDIDVVRDQVNATLVAAGHELRKVTVQPGEIQPIVADAGGSTKPAGEKTGEDEAAKPVTESDEKFAGGRQVELTFSDEIHPTTAQQYLLDEIEKMTRPDRTPKYDEPSTLVEVDGLAGSGATAAAGQVRKYSKVLLKASPIIEEPDLKTALAAMQQKLQDNPIFEEVNTFAPSVASDMKVKAMVALLLSLVVIVGYIWFRFERITFGLAAVVALVHDVLVTLGMVAVGAYVSRTAIGHWLLLDDFKINLQMIAAFLTIIGYSLNDTIVTFDRLRELRGKNPSLTPQMINASVNQTISRTILTATTVFIVVVILYIFGGDGIHGFTYCLLIGTVAGTYSTVYIA